MAKPKKMTPEELAEPPAGYRIPTGSHHRLEQPHRSEQGEDEERQSKDLRGQGLSFLAVAHRAGDGRNRGEQLHLFHLLRSVPHAKSVSRNSRSEIVLSE